MRRMARSRWSLSFGPEELNETFEHRLAGLSYVVSVSEEFIACCRIVPRSLPVEFMSAQVMRAIKRKPNHSVQTERKGTAAVEFAVVAPVLVVIFIGGLSSLQHISVKHNVQMVCYMAAAELSNPNVTEAQIESHYESLGADVGVQDFQITISDFGNQISVIRAHAPLSRNTPFRFYSTATEVSADCYVYRSR